MNAGKLAIVLLFVAVHTAQAAEVRERAFGDDLFMGGDDVAVASDVRGDVMVGGGTVRLERNVGGDAVVAGGRLELGGKVAQDLYAAGGDIRVSSDVSGSARIAGGSVRVLREARIADGLSLAGGDVAIEGQIGRYAQMAGGKLRIDGRVDGDVDAAGGALALGPTAVIEGRLTFRGPQPPTVASGAVVRGGTHFVRESGRARSWGLAAAGAIAVAWFVGWALVGALLVYLAPNAVNRVTANVRTHPGYAALVGFIALCVVPIAIVICAVTVVGIPLAVLALLLYLLLLPVGYLAAVASVSDSILPRLGRGESASRGWRVLVFVVTLLVLAIATQIPFVGALIALALLICGMGGLLLAVTRRRAPISAPTTG